MEITFALTPRDLMALDSYLLRRRLLCFPNALLLLAFLAFVMSPIGIGLHGLSSGHPLDNSLFGPLYLLMFVVTAFLLQICFLRLRTSKTMPEVLASRTFQIHPEGIKIRIEEDTSNLLWSAVQRIDRQRGRIFLLIGANHAIVIAPSAFHTSEMAESFYEEIQRLWKQGKNEKPALKEFSAAETDGPEVRFTLQPDDLAAIDRLVSRNKKQVSPLVLTLVFSLLGALAVGGLTVYFLDAWRTDKKVFHDLAWLFGSILAVSGTIIGTAAVIGSRLHARRYRSLGKTLPSVYEPRLIRLEAHSLFYSDATGERQIPWASVHSVVEDKERLYILLGPRDVCPVPHRAFSASEDRQAFAQFAKTQWRSLRGDGSDNPW